MYQKGPKTLEEIAIKTILKNGTPTGQLPEAIQKKIVHGMYAVIDSTPENITDEGKVIFEKIRRVFNSKKKALV